MATEQTTDIKDIWDEGVDSEIQYWKDVFLGAEGPYPIYYEEMMARCDPDAPVPEYIAAHVPKDKIIGNAKILDVAAGPVSCVGWQINGERPQVTAIDALADQYGEILKEAKIVPPIDTFRCDGEDIKDRFKPESFDLVHIRNALDHCYDAMAVVRNMLQVLTPGGKLLICGHTDEAEFGKYDGLHQWNIRGEGGDVIIWRPGVRHSLKETFADQIEWASVDQSDEGRWTSAILCKKASLGGVDKVSDPQSD